MIKFFNSFVNKPRGSNKIRISGFTSVRGYLDSNVAKEDAIKWYLNYGQNNQIKILFVLNLFKVKGKPLGVAMRKIFPDHGDK